MSGPSTLLRSRVDSDYLLLDGRLPHRRPSILWRRDARPG
jgi:hypothetical protein